MLNTLWFKQIYNWFCYLVYIIYGLFFLIVVIFTLLLFFWFLGFYFSGGGDSPAPRWLRLTGALGTIMGYLLPHWLITISTRFKASVSSLYSWLKFGLFNTALVCGRLILVVFGWKVVIPALVAAGTYFGNELRVLLNDLYYRVFPPQGDLLAEIIWPEIPTEEPRLPVLLPALQVPIVVDDGVLLQQLADSLGLYRFGLPIVETSPAWVLNTLMELLDTLDLEETNLAYSLWEAILDRASQVD